MFIALIQYLGLSPSVLADWLQGLAERCSDSVAVPSEDLNFPTSLVGYNHPAIRYKLSLDKYSLLLFRLKA